MTVLVTREVPAHHSASRAVCTFCARPWPPFTIDKRPTWTDLLLQRPLRGHSLYTLNRSQPIPSAFSSHVHVEVSSIIILSQDKDKFKKNAVIKPNTSLLIETMKSPSRTIRRSLPPTMTCPLFNLPFEIRHKIYQHVFRGSALIIEHHEDPVECARCGTLTPDLFDVSRRQAVGYQLSTLIIRHKTKCSKGSSFVRFRGLGNYWALSTCKTFYSEAHPVLAANLNVYCQDPTQWGIEEITQACERDEFLEFVISHAHSVYFQAKGRGYEPQCAQLFKGAKVITVDLGSLGKWSGLTTGMAQSLQDDGLFVRNSWDRFELLGLLPLQRLRMDRHECRPENAFRLESECWLYFPKQYKSLFVFGVDHSEGAAGGITSKEIYNWNNQSNGYVNPPNDKVYSQVTGGWKSLREECKEGWDRDFPQVQSLRRRMEQLSW